MRYRKNPIFAFSARSLSGERRTGRNARRTPLRVVVAGFRPRRGLTQDGSSECAGRHAHRSPERGDEVRWRRKAGIVRHFGNGFPRFLQQCDSVLEPAENDVPMRCHTRLLVECADEVVDAQACGAGQLVQRWRRDRRVGEGGDDQVIDPLASCATKATACRFGRLVTAMVTEASSKTMEAGFEKE